MKLKATKVKTGIAIGDLHYPYHNKKFWKVFLKLVKDVKPDYFVFGGDQLDMDVVNHHEKGKGNLRYFEGKRLKKMYNGFQEEILDKVEKVLPKKCEKYFLHGNHCFWIEGYIDKHPELEGLAEIEENLDLSKWQIFKYDAKKILKIGKLYFHHGIYTGAHHAKKIVEVYGRSIMTFHLHTYQAHTKVTPIDKEAHTSYSMPCACNKDLAYMKKRPSDWIVGAGVFKIQPNGNFNVIPVISIKDHFVFNGKYY